MTLARDLISQKTLSRPEGTLDTAPNPVVPPPPKRRPHLSLVESRKRGISVWLRAEHPGYEPSNAYLLEGRIENFAWHHGYKVALADVLGLLKESLGERH